MCLYYKYANLLQLKRIYFLYNCNYSTCGSETILFKNIL